MNGRLASRLPLRLATADQNLPNKKPDRGESESESSVNRISVHKLGLVEGNGGFWPVPWPKIATISVAAV